MQIAGFQKLTLSDFPSVMSCIIFTEGCNFRCPFCHNSGLVYDKANDYYTEEEILNYVKKREGILEGIVISGGEPTIQKNLVPFLEKLRKINIKIKLDTNGTNPSIIKYLLDNSLVDYIAMDIKNTLDKYNPISGVKVNINNIKESIKLLQGSNIPHEFRTTIVKEFHTLEDIKNIKSMVEPSTYYLQNFRDNENVYYEGLHSFTKEELEKIKKEIPDIIIRGDI